MPIMFRHPIVIIVNTLLNFVRFKRLPAQVRAAVARLASTPVTLKDSADTMPPSNAAVPAAEEVSIVSDYQPLNKRPPTRKILSPLASYFEALLALPGARVRSTVPIPRCLRPLLSVPMQICRVLAGMGVALAGYMADVVARAHKSQRSTLRETVTTLLEDLQCDSEDREAVLNLADGTIAVTDDHGSSTHPSSSVGELRDVLRSLGTKHRDHIYLRRMEGVGRETGFQQFLETADQVQAAAAKEMEGTVMRQASVPKWGVVPWGEGVLRLLDSACGVSDRYGDFLTTLAAKAGAEFVSAPLKGLGRISEKLWLRPTANPDSQQTFFARGDCANVFDVVRGMLACSTMDLLNICLGLFAACDPDLWHGINEGDLGGGVTSARAAGITEEIHVLRVKNRFRKPTSSGWADLLINFTFLSDPDQHVCEVQLVHEGMLTARKHCNAHTAYSKFRSALELLETFGLMQTPAHTDEAGMDVDTSAKELVGEELVQQRKFVQELDREYDTFLGRYQQMLGILPVVDTDDISTPEDCSTSHDSGSHDTATGSATELKAEVRRLQHENASQQKQITVQQRQIASQQQQITAQQRENISQQQQIDRILLKMKEFERNHSTSKPSH